MLTRWLTKLDPVHVARTQTVLRLPPHAVLLAENTHEPHHAFRLGDCAWGVQFHPEYNFDIMRSYILEQTVALKKAGLNVSDLLGSVEETPVAERLIRDFARIVEDDLDR